MRRRKVLTTMGALAIPWKMNGETTLSLQTKLKKAETGLSGIPVKAIYKHTNAYTDLPGVVSASATIGPVGIEMILNQSSIRWEDEIIADPGEENSTT